MYTIAICDDEQKEIDKIVILLKKYIKNNKLECNIKTFLSAKNYIVVSIQVIYQTYYF